MIINGRTLLEMAPITDMATEKYQEHGVSYGLSEAGYDIRIKQEIRFIPGRRYWEVSIVNIDGKSEYGKFALASTIEHFQMPDNLCAIIHDKSTWARKGLSVFNTVVESGWNGFLTLELVYHGREELIIPAGSGIAQAIFHEVSNPANYNGKYQNQKDEPVPAIMAETGPKYKECRDPIGCSHFGGCTC